MRRAILFLAAVGLSLPVWAADTGGIEGRALIGMSPARGAKVLIDGYGPGLDGKHWEAETDTAGRFVVSNLPSGRYRVSRLVMFDQATRQGTSTTGTGTHAVRAEVKEGTRASVTLGGSGRTVTGRLAAGAELENRQLAFTAGDFRFLTLREKRDDGFPGRHLVLNIERDGAFRCEDVPPGDYDLLVTVRDAGGALNGPEIARIQRSVTVPPDDPTTGKPLDLGRLELQPVKR
jgi:hypothetical protein